MQFNGQHTNRQNTEIFFYEESDKNAINIIGTIVEERRYSGHIKSGWVTSQQKSTISELMTYIHWGFIFICR